MLKSTVHGYSLKHHKNNDITFLATVYCLFFVNLIFIKIRNTQKCDFFNQAFSVLINLKGSYDVISSFPFSLECDKLIVHRYNP